MKLRNILYYLAVIVLLTPQLWAQNTNPVVTNVTFSISGTTVTVHYDVTDAEQSTLSISMEVSSDGGATWNYNFGTATGNIGVGVAIGTNKTITWYYNDVYNPNIQILITANDGQVGGSDCGTVSYSGKTYTTIMIGSQCWLKENLDIGTQINSSLQQTNNSVIEKYCYNNDPNNCTAYGGLYQWAEAVQYQNGATNNTITNPPLTGNVQGICPTGWHIPTIAELSTLSNTVNGDAKSLKSVGWGDNSGVSDGAGTNTSGFSGLLSGECFEDGTFVGLGNYVSFLSSSETQNIYNPAANFDYMGFWWAGLPYHKLEIGGDYCDLKVRGHSIRCVKN